MLVVTANLLESFDLPFPPRNRQEWLFSGHGGHGRDWEGEKGPRQWELKGWVGL